MLLLAMHIEIITVNNITVEAGSIDSRVTTRQTRVDWDPPPWAAHLRGQPLRRAGVPCGRAEGDEVVKIDKKNSGLPLSHVEPSEFTAIGSDK